MLEEFGEELWIADGPTVDFMGLFPYPTRSAVARLGDGGLWVWSPTALDAGLEKDIAALGAVRHLVAPNKLHHLFLGDWVKRFPEAKLWASPGLARRRRDLRFDGTLGDTPDAAWADDLDQVVVHGSFFLDEVFFFHRPSRTALVCDLVQRFPRGSIGGWREWAMRLDALVLPNGSTPRDGRATFWNRRAARAARDQALAWNPDQLLVAHGECLRHDATPTLTHALSWLG